MRKLVHIAAMVLLVAAPVEAQSDRALTPLEVEITRDLDRQLKKGAEALQRIDSRRQERSQPAAAERVPDSFLLSRARPAPEASLSSEQRAERWKRAVAERGRAPAVEILADTAPEPRRVRWTSRAPIAERPWAVPLWIQLTSVGIALGTLFVTRTPRRRRGRRARPSRR